MSANMVEPLLLSVTRILTFNQQQALTNASGFFFERQGKLFLVTSRHVLFDEPSKHFPDRVVIELHTDAENFAQSTGFSIPLYVDGRAVWRQGTDKSGEIDVAAIEIDKAALPPSAVFKRFTPEHLYDTAYRVEAGNSLLVVGFPLGFHDTLHHMPVVRHAIIASSFGLRFQGEGYFLTDARTHRGTSGAPVVMQIPRGRDGPEPELPWMLLGVHSARVDIGTRDVKIDEALGLNCAWYSDILLTLTE